MKAKELYAIYSNAVIELRDEKAALSLLVQAMSKDVLALIEKRHCVSPGAKISCVMEMNDRWNAMCKLDPTFRRDGFLNLIKGTALGDEVKP